MLNAPPPTPVMTLLTPSQGQPGDIVTIDGLNFREGGSGMIVSFGAFAADIISATSTQLVVRVPEGTVTDDVIICVQDECSNTKGFRGAMLAGVGTSGCVCQSETFKAAFLEGQEGIFVDYANPSHKLVVLGDPIVPCLGKIAQAGEGTFDIECQLQELGRGGCRAWALEGLGRIGTPKAGQALAKFINTSTDATNATLLEVATRHLGGLKDPKARPTLFKMLKHPDAHVRVSAITAVASLLNPSDVDALLAATLALPDYHLYPAIVALFPFRDARFVEPLVQRANTIDDPMMRRVVDRAIVKLQSAIESQ